MFVCFLSGPLLHVVRVAWSSPRTTYPFKVFHTVSRGQWSDNSGEVRAGRPLGKARKVGAALQLEHSREEGSLGEGSNAGVGTMIAARAGPLESRRIHSQPHHRRVNPQKFLEIQQPVVSLRPTSAKFGSMQPVQLSGPARSRTQPLPCLRSLVVLRAEVA